MVRSHNFQHFRYRAHGMQKKQDALEVQFKRFEHPNRLSMRGSSPWGFSSE